MSEPDPVAAWVVRVNRLAREIDEEAARLHPRAWHETLAPLHAKYRRVAKSGPKGGAERGGV